MAKKTSLQTVGEDTAAAPARSLPQGEKRAGDAVLTSNELESILLSDMEGLYQAEAAKMMHVSRATYARLVFSARRKIAESLFCGSPLLVASGGEAFSVKNVKCPIHKSRKRCGRLCLCGAGLAGVGGRGKNDGR